MSELELLVDEIGSRLSDIGPADFVDKEGRPHSWNAIILLKVSLTELAERLEVILGKTGVADFFKDCGMAGSGHLMWVLANLLPACCTLSDEEHISLDKGRLLETLRQIAEGVQTGQVDYSLELHLTNIDITDAFELGDSIYFRKVPPEIVRDKYSINFSGSQYDITLAPMIQEHWRHHCVEVVIPRRGTPAVIQDLWTIEQQNATVNLILYPFLLCNLSLSALPEVTHLHLKSVLERLGSYRGICNFSFNPRLLSSDDVLQLKKAYAFLCAAQTDRVLQTAIDRFVLGRKQDLHHPNRVNEPHWDKLVDYVIAMETLFLTANDQSVEQELSYCPASVETGVFLCGR